MTSTSWTRTALTGMAALLLAGCGDDDGVAVAWSTAAFVVSNQSDLPAMVAYPDTIGHTPWAEYGTTTYDYLVPGETKTYTTYYRGTGDVVVAVHGAVGSVPAQFATVIRVVRIPAGYAVLTTGDG